MTPLASLAASAAPHGLAILGGFHPRPGDQAPEGCGTLLLLGPQGTAFWPHFRRSPEARDGARDPLDRWSRRVIGTLAGGVGGRAVFPFDGPPWLPFQAWARRSGHAWDSPVGLLVHETAGLLVSYRGAVALPQRLALPAPGRNPCATCPAPCRDACPVDALGTGGYDVPACRACLDSRPGRECLTRGCAARRACPGGAGAQPDAQSAFHMAAFHGSA